MIWIRYAHNNNNQKKKEKFSPNSYNSIKCCIQFFSVKNWMRYKLHHVLWGIFYFYMKCGYSKFYNNSIKEKSINFNSINNRTFNLNINKFLFSRMNKKKKMKIVGENYLIKPFCFSHAQHYLTDFHLKMLKKKSENIILNNEDWSYQMHWLHLNC